MKIATIIGAYPQSIKAAVVSRAFCGHRPDVGESIAHAGQHYDARMSDVVFDELDICRPDHHFGIDGCSNGQNTGRMIEAIEAALIPDKPDWELVCGDTDSTLAAMKLPIPVEHIEAGLSSFSRRIPEEISRVFAEHVSTLLLDPTELARQTAVESAIGHSKSTLRMDHCRLQGALGDALHSICSAAGYNLHWLLRAIAGQGIEAAFLRLWEASLSQRQAIGSSYDAPRRAWTPIVGNWIGNMVVKKSIFCHALQCTFGKSNFV